MNAEHELASITNFVQAVSARAKAYRADADAEFDSTGHSCYLEGYAAGYTAAAKLILDFIEFPAKNGS